MDVGGGRTVADNGRCAADSAGLGLRGSKSAYPPDRRLPFWNMISALLLRPTQRPIEGQETACRIRLDVDDSRGITVYF